MHTEQQRRATHIHAPLITQKKTNHIQPLPPRTNSDENKSHPTLTLLTTTLFASHHRPNAHGREVAHQPRCANPFHGSCAPSKLHRVAPR